MDLLMGVTLNLIEAKILIEKWRRAYNEFRSHSSIGFKPPAPATLKVMDY
jgi:putative transposase